MAELGNKKMVFLFIGKRINSNVVSFYIKLILQNVKYYKILRNFNIISNLNKKSFTLKRIFKLYAWI